MVKDEFELLAAADCIQPIEADGESIAPGVTARAAPGHTLGHHCLVLSSGTERALLLGDAIACPVQLEEPEWSAMSDVDPGLAVRTREALFRELEDSSDVAVAAHFPELRFGRVMLGEGKRYWA
jgi:glyoxylase-like metal-dependent hydrolase (beta-lactamase superfamily II)